MPRDLTVRVRADVGPYRRAMQEAARSTSELTQAGLKLQKSGLQTAQLGSTLTRNVTLPLALAGGAAIKLASDFDKSFVQMQTLAGVTGDEVAGLKDKVLELAGETGRAPQELGDALYFLQSSGLSSAQAMDALESSAKASAAGLGATEDVANAVSSAMLGYAESGLTAAEATDVLVATAREGKAEPAELAQQMGRLIPVASELGITFGDVGGAIAALSTKGFDTEQAVTALSNVMSKLLKPSQQAEKALEQVGLSTDGIRQMIAERGLLATLEELRNRLGDNGFVKFLEDQQAVQGGLALLGGDLNKTKGIIDAVNDSAGATENAFSTWADSMGAENAQAFAKFQVALIQAGEVLAPIASDILSFVSKIAEAFSDLPAGVQNAIIAFAGLAAAVGPLLSVYGNLKFVLGTVLRLMEGFALPAGTIARTNFYVAESFSQSTTAASGFAASLSRMGLAAKVAGGLLAVGIMAELIRLNNQAFPGITNLPRDIEAIVTATRKFNESAGNQQAIIDWSLAVGDLDDAMTKLLETSPGLADDFIKAAEAAGIPAEKIRELRGQLEEHRSATADAQAANEEWNASLTETGDAAAGAEAAVEEYTNALRAQFDPLFGVIDAQQGLAEALQRQAETYANAESTALDKARADQAVRSAVVELDGAAANLNRRIADGSVRVQDARSRFINMAVGMGIARGDAIRLADSMLNATSKARALGATDPTVDIRANDQATPVVHRVQRTIDGLHGKTVKVSVVASYTASASNALQTFGGRQQSGGQVYPGKWYITGEAGPELFVPDTSGTIVPNHELGSLASSMPAGNWGGGGGGTIVNINVDARGSLNPNSAEIQRMVVGAIRSAGAIGMPITVRGRAL